MMKFQAGRDVWAFVRLVTATLIILSGVGLLLALVAVSTS